jgi:ectoine hydroxylase-related dioxygenase (phytanoyl-CoA dioxygenase family)
MIPEKVATYERDGLLHIRAGVDPSVAATMATVLWSALTRKHGIRHNDPQTWTVLRPTGISRLIPPTAFAAMASPTVCSVLDALLGSDWTRPARWGVTLMSFPEHTHTWDVPHEQWHLDSPAAAEGANLARVFVLLAPMEAQGGNTLVVTGSHHLFQRLAAKAGRPLPSAEANRLLRAQQPWFASLSSSHDTTDRIDRFMRNATSVDGVDVRVVEMTGEPGDVYFMHPFLLHAPSPNVRTTPRLALTQWVEGKPAQNII